MIKKITFLLLVLFSSIISAQQKISFPSSNGLLVTADLYITNPLDSPFIILFHQAGWSRGEYLEIAPKLNKMGYNCIAIDQRSGGKINGVINETHQLAVSQKLETSYVDALPDFNSAIDYVKTQSKNASKIIIWGSSYSAALVLKIAGDRNDIGAVLSFSPGEYFERLGKSNHYISDSAQQIKIPVFITSAKAEKPNWWSIYTQIPAKNKQYFLPKTKGQHGSRALWEKFEAHQQYWKAVKLFLKAL